MPSRCHNPGAHGNSSESVPLPLPAPVSDYRRRYRCRCRCRCRYRCRYRYRYRGRYRASVFIARCQNFQPDPKKRDPRLDDGGFFFIYGDPVRNKAGPTDQPERFRSYGSTTADGLRAWVATGRSVEDPPVAAAKRWLHDNFSAEHVPGAYHTSREPNRDAVYYYYAASVAEAFTTQGPRKRNWRRELKMSLMKRQREDGSWRNPDVFVREDDPLVATPFAVWALAVASQTPSDLR